MPILEADIQIMASQVLADVPEGGGAATGNTITDGETNNLFPDVSELDRVYGDVALRKVFPAVRTADTDTYFGANVIVADEPDDPDVSVVLFSTGSYFDTRQEAASRIESYLAQGPGWQGQLYGNHLAGQMTVTLIQRASVAVPAIGETLVLRKNEGLSSETEQYVRVTDVAASVTTFTDADGDFERLVVICGISDQLEDDYPGFEAIRRDATITYTGKTRVFGTVVADAARYYGIKNLEETAELGDFSVQAEDIFAQLVPSSRTEVAITDARMNQQTDAIGPAGSAVTRGITALLSTTQSLYIGSGVTPNTFSISAAGVTLTDQGGLLMNAGTAVGTIDYENGVLSVSTNVWGVSGQSFTLNYVPGGPLQAVTESIGARVTAENQRLTWIFTLDPVPQPGTLQVSFLAQGRWYVLEDDGSGAIRGGDSSFGAGSLNFTTGTVAVTVGALPDVGSALILTWVPEVTNTPVVTTDIALNQRFCAVIDLNRAIKPGSLTISWNDGSARSVSDDSVGGFTGYGVGKVMYSDGIIYLSPTLLPAPGTVLTVTITEATAVNTSVPSFTDGGSTWNATLAAPVRSGSLEMAVVCQVAARVYPGIDQTTEVVQRIFDDGSGSLVMRNTTSNLTVGTVNYGTGAITINKSIPGFQSVQGVWANQTAIGDTTPRIVYQGTETRTQTLTARNGPAADAPPNPNWAWWTGLLDDAAFVRYSSTDGAGASIPITLNQVFLLSADVINQAVIKSIIRTG